MTEAQAQEQVERSVRAYSRAHRRYERRHPEIFNEVEQARLRQALRSALAAVSGGDGPPRVLDLGCGTGNLTGHLVALGARVVAADVSPEFLRVVEQRYPGDQVTTLRINGVDLSGLADASLDMAAAYSVLHHVPDYPAIVRELVRVVRPGGVVYVDHEVNENFWAADGCLHDFREELIDSRARLGGWWSPDRKVWQRYLIPSKYVFAARMRLDPGWPFNQEGDIHVWPHDHIEWDRVADALAQAGAEVVTQDDYLVFRSDYPPALWEQHRERCSDMRLLIARRVR